MVSDINDHRILWSLDEVFQTLGLPNVVYLLITHQEFCGPFVHCEHDEGYIVFNRIGNSKEVWRRRIDVLDIPEEERPSWQHNKPDSDMVKANRVAETRYFDPRRSRDPDHLRGQFIPWACIQIPGNCRAFKLTQRTLLVSSSQKVFLYDVEQAELEQDFPVHTNGQLRYVDVDKRHMFIVSTLELNVYDRVNGSCVLCIKAGRLPWGFYASQENQWGRAGETFNDGELGFRRAAPPNCADREDYFHAGLWSRIPRTMVILTWLISPHQVHVSSCGKHLAIMALSTRIILIQDFWRLFPTLSSSSPPTFTPSPITLQNISKQVDLYIDRPTLETGGYLAYDRGKVAVAGIHGIFVLVLDSILDQLGDIELPQKHISLQSLRPASGHKPSWPNLRLREVEFHDPEMLDTEIISCLQLTETKLYLSAFTDDIFDDSGENMWCYDFASSPS